MKKVKVKQKKGKRSFKICVQDRIRQMQRGLYEVNICWPWLKIVVGICLLFLVGFGVGAIVRRNGSGILKRGEVMVSQVVDDVSDEVEDWEVKATEAGKLEEEKEEDEVKEEKEDEESAGELREEPEKTEEKQEVQAPRELPEAATGRKLIALTFDDGPSKATTGRLLDILAEKNVKATFFVIGNMVEKSPDLLKREEVEGHEVGSHTATHANLSKATQEVVQWESWHMDYVFRQILGRTPAIMRPPYGAVNAIARQYTPQPMILWSIDPEDWKKRDAKVVRERVVSNASDGAVVLMHDIYATTVDAVPGIIDDLRAKGYEFLTISELAAARGVKLEQGVTYGSFRP